MSQKLTERLKDFNDLPDGDRIASNVEDPYGYTSCSVKDFKELEKIFRFASENDMSLFGW
jgi:hypothetical protein